VLAIAKTMSYSTLCDWTSRSDRDASPLAAALTLVRLLVPVPMRRSAQHNNNGFHSARASQRHSGIRGSLPSILLLWDMAVQQHAPAAEGMEAVAWIDASR